jgi:hypothetical protein
MPTPTPVPDPEALEQLGESTRESIESARDLVDGMKTVQEYENTLLDDIHSASPSGHPEKPPQS